MGQWAGEIGQHAESVGQVLAADVSVAVHRQPDRGVAGQGLGGLGMHAAGGQVADERVTQCVQVRVAAGRVTVQQEIRLFAPLALLRGVGQLEPRLASCVEIGTEHLGPVLAGRDAERRGGGQLAGQVGLERRGGLGPQGQLVFAAVLAVGCGDGHRRLVGLQLKAGPRQAADLRGTKAGLRDQPVEHRPVLAGDPAPRRPGSGRVDDVAQLLCRQAAAVVAAVGLHVQALQVLQRAGGRPAVADHPAAKLLAGLQVEVGGLGGDPLALVAALAKFGKVQLQLAGRQVRPERESARAQGAARPRADQLGMAVGVALGLQRGLPVIEVLGERLAGGDTAGAEDAPLGQLAADRRRHGLDVPGQVRRDHLAGAAQLVELIDLSR